MCLHACVCMFVCVGVNSHACYRWIVNDITDCNSCFVFCFSVSISVLYVSGGLCMFVCLHDYIVTKYLNSCSNFNSWK